MEDDKKEKVYKTIQLSEEVFIDIVEGTHYRHKGQSIGGLAIVIRWETTEYTPLSFPDKPKTVKINMRPETFEKLREIDLDFKLGEVLYR